ncbi:MAG: CheY-like chemotaxis protein [Flavobacteriales bacterium]|jgi:CheY-like chemotaxis protein
MSSKKKTFSHILLVEDNEGDVILTIDAFEESNINAEFSIAKNGKDALDFLFQRGEFVQAKRPDLILLDINLPIFNGHEVLQLIKADLSLNKIPVIMLTTSSNQSDIDKAYENNCSSYMNKPQDISNFLKAILKIEEHWLNHAVLP